jgi:hypothetical protein
MVINEIVIILFLVGFREVEEVYGVRGFISTFGIRVMIII